MNKHKTSTRVPAFATTTVLVVVIVALTIAVSGLGYMQYDNLRKENKRLQEQLNEKKNKEKEEEEAHILPVPTPTPTPTPEPQKPEISLANSELENIKAILNTGDTQPFLGYIEKTVLIHYNSPKQEKTFESVQATLELAEFLNGKTNWTFPISKEQKASLTQNEEFKEYTANNCLVGTYPSQKALISLCFNESKKVTKMWFCEDTSVL